MPNAAHDTNDLPAIKAGLRYPGLTMKSLDPNKMDPYARSVLNSILQEATNSALKRKAAESIGTLEASTDPVQGSKRAFGQNLSFGPVRRKDFGRATGPALTLNRN